MKFRIAMLAVVSIAALFGSQPARLHGQQPLDAQQDEQHHPATAAPPAQTATGQPDMANMMAAMHANDQKLDELEKKMDAAHGAAKVDAIAELLTTLVQDRRTMHESMTSNMSMMMNMMSTMHGAGGTTAPKK
jgi:hypothetical protein